MAEMVWCPARDVASVLQQWARGWKLVAVVKAKRSSERLIPELGAMQVHREDGRELYFERDLE